MFVDLVPLALLTTVLASVRLTRQAYERVDNCEFQLADSNNVCSHDVCIPVIHVLKKVVFLSASEKLKLANEAIC